MRSNRVEGQRADFTEEARGFIKIKLLEKEKVHVDEPAEDDSAAIFCRPGHFGPAANLILHPAFGPNKGCVVSLLIARLI